MKSKLLRYGLMVVGVTTLLVGFQNFSASNQKVQREGTLEVLHEDYPDKSSRTRHYLSDDTGQRYELKFRTRAPQNLLSGSKVRVRGNESGNILYLSDTDSTTIQQLSTAANWAAGEQKTVVLLVNFQDNPIQPVSLATIQNLVFTTVSNFFLENSFQQTWLSGNVFGWYTIPVSSTVCDGAAIRTYAKNAAMAAGVDLSVYSRFIYMFPRNTGCGWGGSGTIGGLPSDTWINGYFELKVVGHELGHNFGLNHSHSLNCDPSPIGSSCIDYDYGDLVDIMGNYKPGHINAYAKEYLGWLNVAGKPPITTVQQSGSYVLEPYAAASGGGAKALKILGSTDSVTGEKTWYYLEYRQAVNFDAILTGTIGNQVTGVEIRRANSSQGSYLLDMTPNSNTLSDTYDMFDGALAVGASFVDEAAGISITVKWANSSGAGVDVVLGSSGCQRQVPSVTMSPSTSASVAPGTAVSYSISVKNNDSSGCAASSFNLAKAVPSGWSSSLSSSSLSLSPGASGSATLTVASATTAAAGSYSISASAVNSSATSYSGSASATYSVASMASLSASVVTSKSTYLKGDSVLITASVSSGSVAVSGASVNFTITKPDGSVVTASAVTDASGKAVYKMRLSRKASAGTYQVRINAISGGSSASAITSFTVQ